MTTSRAYIEIMTSENGVGRSKHTRHRLRRRNNSFRLSETHIACTFTRNDFNRFLKPKCRFFKTHSGIR